MYVKFAPSTTETDLYVPVSTVAKRIVETGWKRDAFIRNDAGVLFLKKEGHRLSDVELQLAFIPPRQWLVEQAHEKPYRFEDEH